LAVAAPFYVEQSIHGRRVLKLQRGFQMDAAVEHVLKGVWDAPPPRTFRIHVEGADGKPAAATLLRDDDECMSSGTPVGVTDEHGDILATFAPELIGSLTLSGDYGDYEMADDELDRLLATGRVSVVLRRQQ
jgi:hypothetical protein